MLAQMVKTSIVKNAKTSVWIIASLTTCALLTTVFVTITLTVDRQMMRTLRQFGANAVVYPRSSASTSQLNSESSARLSQSVNVPAWQELGAIARRQNVSVTLLRLRVGVVAAAPVAVVAADPKELETSTPYWHLTGRRAWQPGECMAGQRAAEALHLEVGKDVSVGSPGKSEPLTLRIVGILSAGDDDDQRLFVPAVATNSSTATRTALLALPVGHPNLPGLQPGQSVNCYSCHAEIPPVAALSQITSAPSPIPMAVASHPAESEGFTYALLSVPGGDQGIEDLQAALDRQSANLAVKPIRQVLQAETGILAKVRLLSALALVVVVGTVSLGVCASVLARIVERRKELALLQALGARQRSITAFLLAEIIAMGVAAATLGFLLGSMTAWWIVQRLFHVSVWPQWVGLVMALIVTTVVAAIAGGLASRRALRLQPALVLRGE